MEVFYTFSILIIIATVFYYINARFVHLPSTIGIMLITMLFSVALVLIGKFIPQPLDKVHDLIDNINFTQVVMGGMLYFLLFAGAIQININDLKEERGPVIVFSSLSVIISTFVVGFALYYALGFIMPLMGLNIKISLIYCLLFGALISPTDPIAVLSILKQAKVSKSLEMKVTGESLFNDGVAVIAFSVIYNIAQGTEQLMDVTFVSIITLLIKEVFGALLVGFLLGSLGFYCMKTASEEKLSVLISISIVITGYMISKAMGISGPLTMVSAGILIGNANRKYSEKKHTENNFLKIFWELTDEILNAILFLLIGFEILLIPNLSSYWMPGLLCIIIVLIARYISIKVPTFIIPFKEKFSHGTLIILVWGGLRGGGGVSIALALSIPDTHYRNAIVAVTYFVVVFSIVVQGLSIGKLAGKIKY